MKHIHSGKLYPFKEICSFKEHIFVQVQDHMFIQGKLDLLNIVAFAE